MGAVERTSPDSHRTGPLQFRLEIVSLRNRLQQTVVGRGDGVLEYCQEGTGLWPTPPELETFAVDDWTAFWELVERLDVWSWGNYHRSAHDGWKWTLEIVSADRRMRATGRNASPPGFGELKRLVDGLVGGRLIARLS